MIIRRPIQVTRRGPGERFLAFVIPSLLDDEQKRQKGNDMVDIRCKVKSYGYGE